MATATASRNGTKTAPAVAEAEETIAIRPLNIKRIVVTIRGTQPLITNKFSDEAERKLEESQSGDRVKAPKQPRLPEQEFLGARYLIEDRKNPAKDVCGFPAAGIKKAMVNAGGRVSDAKMTWLRAIFNVEAESNGLVRIVADPPQMRTDHVVQMGRGNLRYRPHFWPWKMQVPITFNADHVGAQDVVNLLQQAGFSIGIGDWRPEKNGTFGTFEVESESDSPRR
jgi:hypothetical protein